MEKLTANQRRILEILRRSIDAPNAPMLEFIDDSSETCVHFHHFWELKLQLAGNAREFDRIVIVPPGVVHRKLPLADIRQSALIGIKASWLSVSFMSRHVVCVNTVVDELEMFREHLELLERWRMLGAKQQVLSLHSLPLFAELELLLRCALNSEINHQCNGIFAIAGNYISINYPRRNLSAAEVARHVGVCGEQLTRLFKANCGETVRERIISVRMFEACRLLGEKKLTVRHVADMTGWRNHSYFSRAFRRVFKITPSEFAARCRDGTDSGSWWGLMEKLAPKSFASIIETRGDFLTTLIPDGLQS